MWLLEGFTGYLTEAELRPFLDVIRTSTALGSRIVATFVGITRYGPDKVGADCTTATVLAIRGATVLERRRCCVHVLAWSTCEYVHACCVPRSDAAA